MECFRCLRGSALSAAEILPLHSTLQCAENYLHIKENADVSVASLVSLCLLAVDNFILCRMETSFASLKRLQCRSAFVQIKFT